ncbi:regulator [Streptomyces mangrovisoli]|uniref:regulator n=1 Tax=Streptomyces mangrovisoli TaxID=1428628 RepID=UPI000AFC7A27|nr:regulator [Streptomyces mangrovisoli]
MSASGTGTAPSAPPEPSEPSAPAPSRSPMALPWWSAGDTNAFFGLTFNVLVNVLVLTGLLIGVVGLGTHDVYHTVLPALGIELLVGNVYYTYLARRLARREGRSDVTAMPYGPSVPHMFIVTFVIMLPTYLSTKNPVRAWESGLAWAFVIGVIVLIGAFVGPYVRRWTPRAALLGTLAGISVAFISMRPAGQMWEAGWIALPVLVIILIGFFTDLKLPGNIPIGLAALLVGTAIGWIGGFMEPADVGSAVHDIALGVPTLQFHLLFQGLSHIGPLLATAIPLGIYNFTEGMTNVESAAVAGDEYNLRSVLLADGTGAVVGAALGSPFPPAVYIGHPGWKAAGGRTSYSMGTGVVVAALCFSGMFGLLGALLPMPAIVPILLYIGLLIGAQAFQAVPRAHAAAVMIAIIPNVASWAQGQMADVLSAVGYQTVDFASDAKLIPPSGGSGGVVPESALVNAGVIYKGLLTLGEGAVLVGLILGAIVVFLIDRQFHKAAAYCAAGAALSFVGLIHGAKVGWDMNGQMALGYLFAGLVCVGFHFRDRRKAAGAAGATGAAGEVGAVQAADGTAEAATA